MNRLPRSGSSTPETTRVSARYRRPPGGWLLAALLVVPLVLALLGTFWFAGGSRSDSQANKQTDAPVAAATTQAADPDAVEVTRDGKRIVVRGKVPDKAAEQGLLDSVRAAAGDGRVIDEVSVQEGVSTPPLTGIGTVLSAARGIDDFGMSVGSSTVALRGTAPDQQALTSTVYAAGQSYPGLQLTDNLSLAGGADPTSQAPATPLTPECEAMRGEVAEALKQQPVIFALDGAKLDAPSQQRITELGKRLATCSFTSIEVAGHSDSSGSESYNKKLSTQRAEAVREILIAAGVPADQLTARGYGSSKPVADNSTDAGRLANRRVEINAR
ncbi:channel-forming protein ArfA/OmpATb [Gephyromycinifex aptenodytis]|uniref:channel-forming protein ArfA/OmpATb n=1 Tax=Gephyromycinifex aptenodytis TaxID=2716227 RepID=UPI001445C56A|nr:OmpA family protein [Gephyromycinifex aptenodytis]